ncbi:MAG TPA: hypothetical protein VKF83_06435 [Stellaceae bacterium]|nr:hypothetical protein [Stellaceae bacterium]
MPTTSSNERARRRQLCRLLVGFDFLQPEVGYSLLGAELPTYFFAVATASLTSVARSSYGPAFGAARRQSSAAAPTPLSFFQMAQTATSLNGYLASAKPSDLPIEQPTKFELMVKLKRAKALDITIPQSAEAHADTVIE